MKPQAKYRQMAETLVAEIRGGKYASTNLPSENQLARRFGVGRQTVQKAFGVLAARGLIRRSQGKGTFLTAAARHLTGRIALIIHGSGYCEIFAPISRCISHLCQTHGLSLLFSDTACEDNRRRVAQVIRSVRECIQTGADGVIFQPIEFLRDSEGINREITGLFSAAGIPVVLLDSDIVRQPDRSGYDLAAVNHFAAGMKLAAHLREAGARRVAYLTQKNRAPCVQDRHLGIRTGCAGLPLAGEGFFAEPDDLPKIRRLVRTLRPDAIACYNDRQAVLLVKTLAGMGLSVPGDVMVAGFDDVNYATLATPRLTTMRQPCEELAALAFDMLMLRIKTPDAPARETFLDAKLVVRESTLPRR